jgi:heme exporter protein D
MLLITKNWDPSQGAAVMKTSLILVAVVQVAVVQDSALLQQCPENRLRHANLKQF